MQNLVKKQSLLLLFLGIGIFLLFILFSFIVHKDKLKQFDFDTTARFQDQIPKTFDRIFFYQGARTEKLKEKAQTVVVDTMFSTFSEIGKFEPALLFLLVFLFLVRKPLWGVVAFGMFGLIHVIELSGKWFVEHTPPPQFMLRTKHLIDFPQFHVRAENSYPSGHSGRAIFISILLAFFIWKSKRLKRIHKVILIGVLSLYDITMLISRIYLGEHWATDVVGGALLGGSLALFTVFAWYFIPSFFKFFKKEKAL